MYDILNITKALADESRIRALLMLTGGELCVCQIIDMLGLAPSTVSKHMSILRQANLVQSRKEGRWIYYRLAAPDSTAAFEVTQWLEKHLRKDSAVREDRRRRREMKKVSIDEIAVCYRS